MRFLLFIAVTLALYGGLHAYAWRTIGLRTATAGRRHGMLLLAAWLMPAPYYVRILDHFGYPALARCLGWAGYTWMAAVFWTSALGLSADTWNLAVRAATGFIPRARRAAISPRLRARAAAGLIPAAILWGAVEAAAIRTRQIHVRTPALPPGSDPIRIVQISDLHLGLHRGRWTLTRVLRLVHRARPHAIVSTGDLVDSPFPATRDLAALLPAVQPPLGKLAVLGNHDYYLGLPESLAFHEAAGFRLLQGESVLLHPRLVVAGVDDPAGRAMGLHAKTDEHSALSAARPDQAVILLKHRPLLTPEADGRALLQLSGHTHGGQIFPFHVLTRLLYPLSPGLSLSRAGTLLYASRGAGTWGPPYRVLAPPEITLVVIGPADEGHPQEEAPAPVQPPAPQPRDQPQEAK